MQKAVWEEDEISANGLRERWQQVENLEDPLTKTVQVKELRLGTAKTATVYYEAMTRTLLDMARSYIDSWTTIAGAPSRTEGMNQSGVQVVIPPSWVTPSHLTTGRYSSC